MRVFGQAHIDGIGHFPVRGELAHASLEDVRGETLYKFHWSPRQDPHGHQFLEFTSFGRVKVGDCALLTWPQLR